MKILVTGANGYLGRGIVESLIKLGNEVIIADFSLNYINSNVNKFECNIFDVENPYEYFGKPDALLHLAWKDGFVHYSDSHIDCLPYHYHFIKSFALSDIKTISVLGSMHEIGFYNGCINDITPCNPTTPYGISKNALRGLTEMLCNQNNKKFIWLRGYYIVGNSQYGNSIFSKLTQAESKGQEKFPFTMGQHQFDFIDYDQFCEQVALAVTQNEINGIINICSGHPEKLADRVERFIKENEYKIKLEYGVFPERPYESQAIWGDNKKIQEIMERKKLYK